MISIFILPAFYAPSDNNVLGGYISNFWLAQDTSKLSKTYVLCPHLTSSPSAQSETDATVIRHTMRRPSGLRGRLRILTELRGQLENLLSAHKTETINLFFSTTTIPLALTFSDNPKIRTYIICRAYEDFIHGYYNPSPEAWHRAIVKRLLDRNRTFRAYQRSTAIVVNSHWMENAVKKSFGYLCETSVVYPPLDLIIQEAQLMQFDRNVIVVARDKRKGTSLLRRLTERFPHWTFHIFGKNASIASRNTISYGWTPRDALFKSGTLCLIPSHWPEPFGRVAIEAQAYGLPVIAKESGGLPEAVFDPELLVSSDTVDEWARALNFFCEHQQAFYARAEQRQRFIGANFSRSAHLDKLRGLLSKT